MYLNCLGGDLHSSLGSEQLSGCSVQSEAAALGLGNSSLVGQQASSLDCNMHVSKEELSVLELCDRTAELLTGLSKVDGLFHSALCDAECLCSDADTAAVQGLHSDLEALAFCAEEVFLRNDAVGEYDLSRRGAVQAKLLLVLANREAREGALYDECRNALGALGLVGHGKYNEYVSNIAVGDEDLRAVQNVVVTLQLSNTGALCSVRTSVRLGQSESADLVALGQHAEVLLLLLGGAVCDDRAAAQTIVGSENIAGGSALLGQLLDSNCRGKVVSACAAELFGHDHAHYAKVEQLLDVLARVSRGFVGFRCDGLDFVLGEVMHHLANQFLFTGQMEIHVQVSFLFGYLLPMPTGKGRRSADFWPHRGGRTALYHPYHVAAADGLFSSAFCTFSC